ncbi:MAG: hypothetical protein JW727_00625 [Candidatus Aenigmarchaeota archaeon]|nr:hypothetical protein [Candidatus Aenigmarchaeota archaeon]
MAEKVESGDRSPFYETLQDPVKQRGYFGVLKETRDREGFESLYGNDVKDHLRNKDLYEIGVTTGHDSGNELNRAIDDFASRIDVQSDSWKDEVASEGWKSPEEYGLARVMGFDNRDDFVDAVRGGFDSSADFGAASRGGFSNFDEWAMAKDAGYSSASSYDRAVEKIVDGLKDDPEELNNIELEWGSPEEYAHAKLAGFESTEFRGWENAKEAKIFDKDALDEAAENLQPSALNRWEWLDYQRDRGVLGEIRDHIESSLGKVDLSSKGINLSDDTLSNMEIALGALAILGAGVTGAYALKKLTREKGYVARAKDKFYR